MKASGGTIADQQFTTDKATDFTAILTAVKAKKPDVVFYGGMDATGGQAAWGVRAACGGSPSGCPARRWVVAAATAAPGRCRGTWSTATAWTPSLWASVSSGA